jgi:hypothetical protein
MTKNRTQDIERVGKEISAIMTEPDFTLAKFAVIASQLGALAKA